MIRRQETSSIRVAVREPGGQISDAILLAGGEARGVDDVAIAVNAAGDVLVAYKTGTQASHLGLQGSIAVAYRPPGRSSFSKPKVVDRMMSNAPVVALARDGTGVVTWTRGRPLGGTRRQSLMAITIARDGVVGRARPIARRVLLQRPVAVAGSRGAVTIAYDVTNRELFGRRGPAISSVRAIARSPGGTFGSPRRVFETPGVIYDVAFAADEQGRATLTWTDSTLDSSGRTGPARIRIAAGRVGGRLGRARVVGRPGNSNAVGSAVPVSIAAQNGRVALAWTTVIRQRPIEIAEGPWNRQLAPQHIPDSVYPEGPPLVVVIAGGLHVSALWRDHKLWISDGP